MNQRNRIWLQFGAALSTALILASCGQNAAPAARPARAPAQVVSTTPAQIGPITSTLSYAGTVAADVQVSLVPKTSGVITSFPVAVGATTKQGQVIAQLDNTTQQAALQQAQAALVAAQANETKTLQGATAGQVDVAQAGINSAQASVSSAQNNVAAAQRNSAADAANGQQAIANAQAALASAQQQFAVAEEPHGTYQTAIANAQTSAANAQKNAATVTQQVAATLQGDQTAVNNAQQAVANAQQNLANAQATVASGTPVQQQQLAQAKNNLFAADVQRDGACNLGNHNNTSVTCNAANATVNAQQTAIDTIVAQIQQTQTQAKATLAQAQQAITTAQGQLKTAQDAMATDRAKQDATLQTAQAALDQANGAVAAAQAAMKQAVTSAQAAIVTAENQLKTDEVGLPQTETKDAASVTQSQGLLRSAISQVGSAQANYQNVVQPPTQADIDAAKALVQQAQAALVAAQTALDQMKITAPFDGVLAEQLLQVGALATPTAPVATLVSTQVQVQVNVEQANIGQVSVGQPVALTVTAYPGVSFPAKITLISPIASATSHVFLTDVTPEPADPRLKPGMFATVIITTKDVPKATLVPRDAVVQQNNQNVVFTVAAGKAVMVPVQLGVTSGTVAQIVTGIKPGEPVITVGQTALTPGEAVTVVRATAPITPGTSSGGGANATPGASGASTAGAGGKANATPGAHRVRRAGATPGAGGQP